MRERAGRGDTVGPQPARGVELRGGGAPHGGVHVHGREGDVEDLPGFDAYGGERFARGRDDGLAERDDVVAECDALCLRRGGVQAETVSARRQGGWRKKRRRCSPSQHTRTQRQQEGEWKRTLP